MDEAAYLDISVAEPGARGGKETPPDFCFRKRVWGPGGGIGGGGQLVAPKTNLFRDSPPGSPSPHPDPHPHRGPQGAFVLS